ncbi:MAG: hypothetical protein K1Y36_11100 [Blastocatellia bacterium]|nr:hypothetical protein [Blastocatellia bacterium]
MLLRNHARKLILSICAFALLGVSGTFAQSDEDYTFKVHNTTRVPIRKILVSEDGKKYVAFRLKSDIQPGQVRQLVWDEDTDDQSCKQYIKAVYADGRETRPAIFDFCKEDLVLKF